MYPIIDVKKTGKHLEEIMKTHQMSVKELQRYLGLSCVQSIYHWLNGTSMPTIDNLYAMSALFKIPIDEMICGTRNQNEMPYSDISEVQRRRLLEYYHKMKEYHWVA